MLVFEYYLSTVKCILTTAMLQYWTNLRRQINVYLPIYLSSVEKRGINILNRRLTTIRSLTLTFFFTLSTRVSLLTGDRSPLLLTRSRDTIRTLMISPRSHSRIHFLTRHSISLPTRTLMLVTIAYRESSWGRGTQYPNLDAAPSGADSLTFRSVSPLNERTPSNSSHPGTWWSAVAGIVSSMRELILYSRLRGGDWLAARSCDLLSYQQSCERDDAPVSRPRREPYWQLLLCARMVHSSRPNTQWLPCVQHFSQRHNNSLEISFGDWSNIWIEVLPTVLVKIKPQFSVQHLQSQFVTMLIKYIFLIKVSSTDFLVESHFIKIKTKVPKEIVWKWSLS